MPPCAAQYKCHHAAQNLACGVLEGKPVAEDDAPTDEPIDELQLPARQTPAVALAAQAGRILVSEVEPLQASAPAEEEQACEPEVCADPPKTRKRRG